MSLTPVETRVSELVHLCYWDLDINCARTVLHCLSELFRFQLDSQVSTSAIGLNGAGRSRGQCGLLEGALMFIALYATQLHKSDKEIVRFCQEYATVFKQRFGCISCRDLRPNGFQPTDPPHMCENLMADAVTLAHEFVSGLR